MKPFQWTNPTTVAEAVAALREGGALKAGGIDLVDLMKEGLIAPPRLVNLRSVRGLDRLEAVPGQGLRVGPLVTLARLADDAAVRRRFRALADAAGHAATPQIRNVATIAGNLLQRPRCWYFRSEAFACRRKGGTHCFAIDGENAYHAIFDNGLCAIVHPSATATALVALGATLAVTGPGGPREVGLESIFVGPSADIMHEHRLAATDVITEVRVPEPSPGAASAYGKLGEKESFDWPLAEVACVIERAGGRCKKASVILGAAAPTPHRAREAEAVLTGQALTEDVARAAARAALRGATPLSQNGYKVPMFEALMRRTILAAMTDREEAR